MHCCYRPSWPRPDRSLRSIPPPASPVRKTDRQLEPQAAATIITLDFAVSWHARLAPAPISRRLSASRCFQRGRPHPMSGISLSYVQRVRRSNSTLPRAVLPKAPDLRFSHRFFTRSLSRQRKSGNSLVAICDEAADPARRSALSLKSAPGDATRRGAFAAKQSLFS
jgi:hypothetical protein